VTHWYVHPPERCVDCDEIAGHENHKTRCHGTYSFGAGFAFCQLEQGHEMPHVCLNWDGATWSVGDDITSAKQLTPRDDVPSWYAGKT
jgi:hypothetical protein